MAAQPSVRPWLLLAPAAVFVAMAVGSFNALPDEGRSGNLWLVAVPVLVATPATLVLNALEYRGMARALDHDIHLDAAVPVSLVASLANYLPAPGGVAVRTGGGDAPGLRRSHRRSRPDPQPERSRGPDPTTWLTTASRTGFAPGLIPDTIRTTNRPTFQQVLELVNPKNLR